MDDREVDVGGANAAEPDAVAVQDAVWLARFHAQATTAMLASVARFAARRAYYVAKLGGRTDPVYAEELVADAVADTLVGRVTWEPARCSLWQHLCGVIRSRSRHDGARAVRHTDVPGLEVPSAATLPAVALAWTQFAATAAADAEVHALFTAYADGAERRDLLAAGWSPLQYAAARKRLRRRTARWLAAD